MSKHMHRDMDLLDRHLLTMSSMVEEMVDNAARALAKRALELVSDVLQQESVIDEREVTIEEECLKILALHQPVAGDLRRVATVLKVNSDLERIADLAVNIAERAVNLAESPEFPIPPALERMALQAIMLVRRSLDCFVQQDVAAARLIIADDDLVDELNREVIDTLTQQMGGRPDLLSAALHCFSASRHIERIADHATNIAEDVIYLVEGEIARHKHEQMPNLNGTA